MSIVYDTRPCQLGEGPLWHPLREQLFWFDIMRKRLLSRDATGPLEWQFDELVSAAAWISRDDVLVASETALFRFNLATGTRSNLVALEGDNTLTRSNDGRADPMGGFWIGTMGKNAEPGAGAIYRYYRGELRRLYAGITIPNAICFSPDAGIAYFTDTVTARLTRVALDAQGWPKGDPEIFLDLTADQLNPDGAVIALDGSMWLAQWGASRVANYAPDGSFLRAVGLNAPHTSCPAFGGPDMTTLYCTSALQGMSQSVRADKPDAGKTFAAAKIARGQYEHQFIL